MPPKAKITKEAIVAAAIDTVRTYGAGALNARALANALQCSTQPIFSNFASMEEVRTEVLRHAELLYQGYLQREIESRTYPPYKASGMGYIRFAAAERELFKLLFMRDRSEEGELGETAEYADIIKALQAGLGLSAQDARMFHLEMWLTVHGIATMTATGYLTLEEETVSAILTDSYQGLRIRYQKEEQA